MALSVYLNFDSNCRQAVAFYAEVFDTQVRPIMTFGQMPGDGGVDIPGELKDLVLHTDLDIMGTMVMCSDVLPGLGPPLTVGNQVSLVVGSRDREQLQHLYDRLSEGGTVEMPLQETFFSRAYGALTDRFGVSWMLVMDDEDTD